MTSPIVCGIPLSAKRVAAFWSHVDRRGPDECWPWTGCVSVGGYGMFNIDRVPRLAHRVAWELVVGPLPRGELYGRRKNRPSILVCHKCDNPPCCNPACLFLGTTQDNADDMVRKGRDFRARRLTPDAVVALREDRRSGMTLSQLAEKYGVAGPTIHSAVHGLSWKHIGGPTEPSTPGNLKLSKQDVEAIRRLRLVDGLKLREIAEIYGISIAWVSLIARGLRHG